VSWKKRKRSRSKIASKTHHTNQTLLCDFFPLQEEEKGKNLLPQTFWSDVK
jgi:hypothetical protein